jgi:hypothetical protein
MTFSAPFVRFVVSSYGFGAGGGNSLASTTDWNPFLAWEPSQNGLFPECPQRHREIAVRPARPNSFPCPSLIVKLPEMRRGPLGDTVISVFSAIDISLF